MKIGQRGITAGELSREAVARWKSSQNRENQSKAREAKNEHSPKKGKEPKRKAQKCSRGRIATRSGAV